MPIQTREGQTAAKEALSTAKRLYSRIASAKRDLSAAEASGKYSEAYLSDNRSFVSRSVAESLGLALADADDVIEREKRKAASKIDRAKAKVNERDLAAANASISMLLNDPRDPDEVIGLLEKLGTKPADRLALEGLLERVLPLLPEGSTKRQYAEARYSEVSKKLEPHLDEAERSGRQALRELDKVRSYFNGVQTLAQSGVAGLADAKEAQINLSVYSMTSAFEKEEAGGPLGDAPRPTVSKTVAGSGGLRRVQEEGDEAVG